ncbi:hypothetical protein GUJ93_ZPchr0008g13956 [Zizania palustris]|uniref:Uncharacterized protein n=1 Tax=Zizania palustris TaxID=103762 RepID=A0A8J5VJL8_ZIZPA|nr:hypothetical protein GUJ93_ZPchr0008g13956 [Zizania palustris]
MPSATNPDVLSLILNLEDSKGDFSFDGLFGSLVDELLPELRRDDALRVLPLFPPMLLPHHPSSPLSMPFQALLQRNSLTSAARMHRKVDRQASQQHLSRRRSHGSSLVAMAVHTGGRALALPTTSGSFTLINLMEVMK